MKSDITVACACFGSRDFGEDTAVPLCFRRFGHPAQPSSVASLHHKRRVISETKRLRLLCLLLWPIWKWNLHPRRPHRRLQARKRMITSPHCASARLRACFPTRAARTRTCLCSLRVSGRRIASACGRSKEGRSGRWTWMIALPWSTLRASLGAQMVRHSLDLISIAC